MNEAPERLWVFAAEYGRKGFIPMGDTEYIRADLAAERERKLVEALKSLTDRDVTYDRDWILIPTDSHGHAIATMLDARATLKEMGYE